MYQILSSLKTLLQDNLTARGATTFFVGKQEIPARSDLPVVMVYGTDEITERSGTVRDSVQFNCAVEIIADVRQYFDSVNGQGDKLDAYEALVKMVAERDADGDLLSNTVKGILNGNLTVSGRVLYTDNVTAAYDPYFEAGEFPYVRVVVTFSAYDRPNRT